MFSTESGDGDKKSNSPFGSIRIEEELSNLTMHFGRSEIYLRSGHASIDYPDRLFVATDPIGNVHYDTIYLLGRLFGNSITPGYLNDLMEKKQPGKKRNSCLTTELFPTWRYKLVS